MSGVHLDEDAVHRLLARDHDRGSWVVWLYHVIPVVLGIALVMLGAYGTLALVAGLLGGHASCQVVTGG